MKTRNVLLILIAPVLYLVFTVCHMCAAVFWWFQVSASDSSASEVARLCTQLVRQIIEPAAALSVAQIVCVIVFAAWLFKSSSQSRTCMVTFIGIHVSAVMIQILFVGAFVWHCYQFLHWNDGNWARLSTLNARIDRYMNTTVMVSLFVQFLQNLLFAMLLRLFNSKRPSGLKRGRVSRFV